MEVCIREWRIADAEILQKNANQKEIADNLTNGFPYPYTIEDACLFIDFCLKADKNKYLWLAIEVDGSAAGGIGLTFKEDVYCKRAELGYWLGKAYWGKGIMPKAVRMICDMGFAVYDIVRIYAEIFAYNTGSQRVLQKCGFNFEGRLKKSVYKNNALHDSLMFALIKE